MTQEELMADRHAAGPWAGHRFGLMVAITVAISLFLVAIALALYASSGAAQLDLSRPGYVSVREKASRSDTLDSFPATGVLDKNALEQFRKLYDQRVQQIGSNESFGGDVMSDASLSIDAPGEMSQ